MSKVVDTSTIGGRIKKSRIEKGMSQMNLAFVSFRLHNQSLAIHVKI